MRVSIVQEHRFVHTPDGATYDAGQASYALWRRYLDVFEEVQLVGRSRPVASVPQGYRRVDGPGVRVYGLPYYHGPGDFMRRVVPLSAALRGAFEPEDAVILRVGGTLASLAAPLLESRRQPYAVEVINDPQDVFSPLGGVQHPLRPLFRWVFTRLIRRQCREAAAVQYVTQETLQQRYPARAGVPTFGVSDVQLPPEAFGEPRRYAGLARRAVLVGSLDQWYKSPDVVLRALAHLRARGLDLHFTLVGEGRLRPEVQALARDLGVAGACTFTGQLGAPTEVREVLRTADLMLMPSRTEGLPRALLEGMAQGLPAIGSRVGGIPELLAPDLLVEPGSVDDLVRVWGDLATDPARLTAQSARNLAVARGYADDVLAARRQAFLKAVRLRGTPSSGTGT